MIYTYYKVVEVTPTGRRRIYTFDNEMAAHSLVELLHSLDPMPIVLEVEAIETST